VESAHAGVFELSVECGAYQRQNYFRELDQSSAYRSFQYKLKALAG
jgi:hypothetical protein